MHLALIDKMLFIINNRLLNIVTYLVNRGKAMKQSTKLKSNPQPENWETYFEGSPAKARVIHYIRHICLHGKYKCVNMKYQGIVEGSGISKRTVVDTIKEAVELGIILKLSLGFKKRRVLTWLGDLPCAKLEKTEVRRDLGLPSLTAIAPRNALKVAPQIALYNTVHKSTKPEGFSKSLSFQKEERGSGAGPLSPPPSLTNAQRETLESRVNLKLKEVRESLISGRYRENEVTNFFEEDLAKRKESDRMGFLDPKRASNDWEILIARFKKKHEPKRLERVYVPVEHKEYREIKAQDIYVAPTGEVEGEIVPIDNPELKDALEKLEKQIKERERRVYSGRG